MYISEYLVYVRQYLRFFKSLHQPYIVCIINTLIYWWESRGTERLIIFSRIIQQISRGDGINSRQFGSRFALLAIKPYWFMPYRLGNRLNATWLTLMLLTLKAALIFRFGHSKTHLGLLKGTPVGRNIRTSISWKLKEYDLSYMVFVNLEDNW